MEECTAGWIKTPRGYIIFKNQDLRKEKKKGVIQIKKDLMLLKDNPKIKGCWFGSNKYFSICTLSGPYKKKGGPPRMGSKHISEFVLKNAKTIEEAYEMFKKGLLKENTPNSRNVIIGNEKEAIVLEARGKKIKSKKYSSRCFRANTFLLLKGYNKYANKSYPKKEERSKARLKRIIRLTRNIKKGEQLKSILREHSEKDLSSLCRHDYSITTGSVILEKRGKEVLVYYVINNSPCRKKYSFRRIK